MGAFLRRTVPLCCALLAALASAGAPSATAATPCGEAVILDWSDGTLDRVYSVACYRDALARLPEDLRAYSTAPEDIERALLERARADVPSASAEAPAAEAEEAPRSLAGPTATPTTTEEEAAPRGGARCAAARRLRRDGRRDGCTTRDGRAGRVQPDAGAHDRGAHPARDGRGNPARPGPRRPAPARLAADPTKSGNSATVSG